MASSSSSPSWKYDVFLSFRGHDTRKTFVDHLYTALVDRLVCTYKDDETLLRGDTISLSLLKAIEESQIAIIIFSKNYADSSWCLDELEYIMKCKEERGLIVLTIFYHVKPTDVRKLKRKYEEAFSKHESDNNKFESWRRALIAAANIAGWEINHNVNRYEAKCMKDIVGSVLDKLLYFNSVVDENLVGMGARLQDLKSQLKIESGGVRMVGIWGIGGGGKTTLASSLYMKISSEFDSSCFLGNIKDESSKHGIETLQRKILSTVLKTEVEVPNVDIGKQMIRSRLGRRNVLLVLDDIDDRKQLEGLAGSHDWFGDGSRIIITTRNKQLLITHKVDEVSHVSLLSKEEAFRLFYRRAYNENKPVEDYKTLSQRVVSYAAGLPLALIVLGSFLYDKDKDEWISTLNRLKDIPEMEIMEKLKISYDGLKPLEKELFLDIACFYMRGMKKDEAMEILEACGFHPVIGVKVLIQKALITISDGRYFEMHDLIQEMGHYIVRGEHPNNPEKHSRLWLRREIKDMCYGNTTTENNRTETIISRYPPSVFGEFLSKAKKLRLLYVVNRFNRRDTIVPEYLSNELQYMYWKRYPASPFPESFQPKKLVVLKLTHSLQEELWLGYKYLPCLKELYLHRAYNLVRTPDFGGLPCLEKLTLENCWKLKRIEGNFHGLKHLRKCVIRNESGGPIMQLNKNLFNEHIHLEELYLNDTRQPCNFYLPRFITRLTLSSCGMKDVEIPFGIVELSNLQELDLSRNDFSLINISLSHLTRLKLLNLTWCRKLVELPKLPTSIAILLADYCKSLEVVGDIHTNCKWLCHVSINKGNIVTGGYRLLQSMLEGNVIENGCMNLQLKGVEIPKRWPRLLRGCRYRLELPENWYSRFSGFLLCAAMTRQLVRVLQISMKHENGGLMTDMNSEEAVYWEESKYDDLEETCVGYVSFGSLKHTLWWHPTSTNIEFSFDKESEKCSGFGVRLVSKTSETGRQLQTTTDSSSDDGYKCNFSILHDSRSRLEGIIRKFPTKEASCYEVTQQIWRGYKVMVMLDACGFHLVIGVKALIQKALVTISNIFDVFQMHDLVQQMGHYVVRKEHPRNPEKEDFDQIFDISLFYNLIGKWFLVVAHSVWVNESQIGFFSTRGVKVSHCPAAAMRMLEFASTKEMFNANVCVSLGTDGAPSNNRMSIIVNEGREVYSKGTTDPAGLSAESIQKMATVNGTKVVLWGNDIGSLEVGKQHRYCLRSENIVSVICIGQNQKIMNVDEAEITSMAKNASARLLKRAGIQIPNRMNFI